MFIRVVCPKERKEILVNTDHIWKIEVQYAVPGEGGQEWFLTSVEKGTSDPEAVRTYAVFVGSEVIRVSSAPKRF
jgi:hypothetical protein